MNYRHAYHAGNFADVMKHAVLSLVIEHLKRKPAPFRVIDTHAGVGIYDLSSEQATKTGEADMGITQILKADLSPDASSLLDNYLNEVRKLNGPSQLRTYPGSPMLARRLMRPCDTLVANELHEEDLAQLKATFHRDRTVKVMGLDGWVALKSLLPPKERRGVILIDPPFENTNEFENIVDGVREAMRRFKTGTYLLWYPIKDEDRCARFKRELKDLGLPGMLDISLMIRAAHDPDTLNGCGIVVINPPFALDKKLLVLMPELARVLAHAPGAKGSVSWLTDES